MGGRIEAKKRTWIGRGRAQVGLLALGLSLGTPGVAGAEPGFDANRYLAPPLPSDGLSLARPQTLAAGAWGFGASLSHADDALVARLDDGGEGQIIEEQLWLYLFLSRGITNWLTLHASLPVPIRQVGDAPAAVGITPRLHAFAAGDLKLGARLRFSGPARHEGPIALALDGSLLIPTGSREAFASDGKIRVQVTGIAEAIAAKYLFVGLNVGVLTRPELEVAGTTTGTMLQLAAAAGFRAGEDALRLGLEGITQIPVEHRGASYELLGVANVTLLGRLHGSIGAGPGIGSGWQTPDFRAVLRLGWGRTPR